MAISAGTVQVTESVVLAATFPPFQTSTFASQLLWLAVTFGVLWWLMQNVVLPRIGGILETRRDRIANDLDEAERLRDSSASALAGYEKALADAKANGAKLALEARDAIAREVEAKKVEVEGRMAAKLADAEARITAVKDKAMAEVGGIAAATTEAIVTRLAGAGVPPADIAAAVAQAMKR